MALLTNPLFIEKEHIMHHRHMEQAEEGHAEEEVEDSMSKTAVGAEVHGRGLKRQIEEIMIEAAVLQDIDIRKSKKGVENCIIQLRKYKEHILSCSVVLQDTRKNKFP